jgi:CRP/FNR family transcriptional regulator
MEIITSINTERRSPHLRRNINHQKNEIRQFGVADLMATIESCTQMRDIASSKNLNAGETLFWEDDTTEYAYFLTDGTMKAYKLLPNGRSQIVRFVTAGEIIASTCYTSHTYSTEALSDCTILQLPRKRFDKIIANDPVLMKSVTNKLSLELQQAQKQILLLGRMPAIERVSNFLLDIAERQNPKTVEFKPGFIFELPMARADIADYLGLTIETVSRAFSKFRRDGLIDLPRPNLVCLRDQTGLQQQSLLQTY